MITINRLFTSTILSLNCTACTNGNLFTWAELGGGGGGGFLRTTDIWQFQTMYNIFQHINFKLIIQPLYIYQTYSFNYSNKHTWVYNYVQQCHANCNYKYYTLPNIMRIHLPISTLRKLDCDFQYIMTFSVVAYSKAHYIYI